MLASLQYILAIEDDIMFLTTFLFNILAFSVFCYFLRRRYLLEIEIKNVLKNNTMMSSSHQNHLKNLQIKSMITNFIILIVFVEFMFNFSVLGTVAPSWWSTFNETNLTIYRDIKGKYPFFRMISTITLFSHIAIPCLLLKVLLLTYFHCPYRYTVMRWSVYIIVRIVFFALINLSLPIIYVNEIIVLQDILRALAYFVDIITYIIYSRRFYLHLKSREKEARLFKDRITYLNEQAICIHFKVASILVTIAFFALVFPLIIFPIIPLSRLFIENHHAKILGRIIDSMHTILYHTSLIIYSLVFILNYLYMTSLVVGSYLIQKRGLVHVNKKIKPIITAYHKSPHFARNFNSY